MKYKEEFELMYTTLEGKANFEVQNGCYVNTSVRIQYEGFLMTKFWYTEVQPLVRDKWRNK